MLFYPSIKLYSAFFKRARFVPLYYIPRLDSCRYYPDIVTGDPGGEVLRSRACG
jgi:hypothetical protein